MDMNSFVVRISGFFLMDTGRESNFETLRKEYIIPKYQREYKWTAEKVKTLLTDINNRDKFLGNLILNKVSDYYEIVDGQQRITTIILILIALFNKNKLPNSTELSEEQREIIRYIFKNNHLVLQNESIGDYIRLIGNEMTLNINTLDDIYFQKTTFINTYNEIKAYIDDLDDINSFQKKVLDCKTLVLIGETEGSQNDSIEEVFLDINFKSQLLDVADIFKGYCFKNYAPPFHNELKGHWTEVRKYTKIFERIGYKDQDTCEYIYHYLLSRPETYRIPVNLSSNGRHYLEGKNHTETKKILLDMGSYGKHIDEFIDNLYKSTYIFDDLCSNAANYQSDIQNHRTIKQLLLSIMTNPNVQYYKFPLFMFIHYIFSKPELKAAFSYDSLKRFTTNYYSYSFLFINDKRNKNKTAIDQTIFTALYKIDSGEPPTSVISGVLNATKELRKKYLEEYKQFDNFILERAYALYSLIDNYISADNYLNLVYALPEYNREHLIAHGNDNLNITWEEAGNQFVFSLKQLIGQPNGRTYKAKQYRTRTANYIILPEDLNGSLGQKDIVEKIHLIKDYYANRNFTIPKHIMIFLTHIEDIAEYSVLSQMKGQENSENDITSAYKAFVTEYFSEERQRILYEKLENSLRMSFQNHT